MNAPWSPSRGSGGGANRDPFAAFICDDNSADVIRPVVVEMGLPVEKVHKGGLRNAVQTLSVAASPNILFVDLSESGDPLNDINALAEVCEPGTVVIAIGQVNDVRLYRDLLSSGILSVQGHLFVVSPTGVFRSDNQGDGWSAAGMVGVDVRCIAAVDSTLFVGTNGSGIFRSTDFGASWTAVNTGLTGTNFRAIESVGGTLFAGGQIGTGVFRSTNLGATWTLLRGGLPSGSYRGFATDGRVIVAGSFSDGVFYSVNYGASWTAINTGLTDLSIFDLTIHQGTLLAATNTQGVFRFAMSNLVDLDGDRCIGAGDLAILLGAWGPCQGCAADLNGDASVNSVDLAVLLSYWGACG